jgi:hypothetical protein
MNSLSSTIRPMDCEVPMETCPRVAAYLEDERWSIEKGVSPNRTARSTSTCPSSTARSIIKVNYANEQKQREVRIDDGKTSKDTHGRIIMRRKERRERCQSLRNRRTQSRSYRPHQTGPNGSSQSRQAGGIDSTNGAEQKHGLEDDNTPHRIALYKERTHKIRSAPGRESSV